MGTRPNAVKREYAPARNDEVRAAALFYMGKLSAPGVLPLFTAENSNIDGSFVTNFQTAIDVVGNVVPSRTIRSTNRDITKGITDASKKSVKYGKKLTIFLKKAFLPAQPGLFDSFPVLAANNKMRDGDTEGFLLEVNTIIQQIQVAANQAALLAKGWPVSNLTDYQTLHTTVEALNTQQEMAKQMIPENTDAATSVRNACWVFVKDLVDTKDLVYDEDPLQKHNWAVSTILNQIRHEGGGAAGVVKEADVNMGEVKDVDMSGVTANPTAQVTIIISSSAVNFSASDSPGSMPGPMPWMANIGTHVKTQAEFASAIGAGGANKFVKAQGAGPGVSHYRLVFAE